MPVTTTNTLLIAFFDSLLSTITPTANFTPPSGFPLSNLSSSSLSSHTRTPDLTADRIITWDLGSSREFNTFALMGSNATLEALGQFEAADNLAFSSGLIQSTASLSVIFDYTLGHNRTQYVAPWGRNVIYVHPTSITKRYIRWHQSDTTNPEPYQQWAIAHVGLSLQLKFQGWKKTPDPYGPIGSEIVLRGHEFTFMDLTQSQAYDLESLALVLKQAGRMLVIPEPLVPATWLLDAIWCTFEGVHVREPLPGMSHRDKRWRVTLMFREVDH